MLSALYVALAALLIIKLSFDVIRLRTQYGVWHGDGGFYDLQVAIRIQSNAVEYLPIASLLLLLMEMNGADMWMIHLTGIVLLIGRLLHAYGLRHHDFFLRRIGMNATFCSLILMILLNLYYIPWDQFIPNEY